MSFDPRTLAGPAMLVIGLFLVTLATRMWFVHPLNIVLRFGPYVTEDGIKAVLGMRLFIFALGAFLLTWGASNIIYWWIVGRDVAHPLVVFFGTLGTGLGIWAACQAGWAAMKLWLIR